MAALTDHHKADANVSNPRALTPEERIAEWMSEKRYRILTDDVRITYLAEGAANIVYRLSGPGSDDGWTGKLLRLRKDVKTAEPVIQTHANFVSYLQPLLPEENVLHHQLLLLTSSNIISRLNQQLKAWEAGKWHPGHSGSRPSRRQGVYLAKDNFGLLIDDMSPAADEHLIQFKPKWLRQSPNAPPASKRCRVCALRARRNAEALRNNPPISSLPDFCPLTIVSQSQDALEYAALSLLTLIASDKDHPDRDNQTRRLKEWIKTTSLFRDLEALQRLYDPEGVLGMTDDKDDMKLRVAMTLRDISVYIILPHNTHQPIRAQIADLDLKSSKKFESWMRTEEELVSEGWYEGIEDVRQPVNCWIDRI